MDIEFGVCWDEFVFFDFVVVMVVWGYLVWVVVVEELDCVVVCGCWDVVEFVVCWNEYVVIFFECFFVDFEFVVEDEEFLFVVGVVCWLFEVGFYFDCLCVWVVVDVDWKGVVVNVGVLVW